MTTYGAKADPERVLPQHLAFSIRPDSSAKRAFCVFCPHCSQPRLV